MLHPLRVLALLALAPLLAGAAPPVPASERIAVTFRGQVELPTGPEGDSVMVSTDREEVVVAPTTPAARALRRLEGRTVTLHGWIRDEPQQELVMHVTRFAVEGERHSFLQGTPARTRTR